MMQIVENSGRYARSDNSVIECIIVLAGEEMPYSAADGDPTTQYVWDALIAGDAGEIAAYVEPEPPAPSTDPADYPLLPWQFKALIIYLDKDAEVRAFIGQIEHPLERAAALSRYENASMYEWADPLMQAARAGIGMSEEDLSAAWMLAKDLRST